MSKQKAKQHHNCSRGFRPVVGVMNLPFQGCARIARAAAALVFHLHIYYISLYYYLYYILSIIINYCSDCCCTCIPPTKYDLSSATKIVNKCKIKRCHLLLCLTSLRSTENHSLRSIWGKKNRFLLIKEASLQPFNENATLRHWYLKHMTWLGSPKKL